jgi:hypothetical protein
VTSPRAPWQRVLDVVVFGPVGIAVTIGEEFPRLVTKGHHRVEGQVHTARLVGQFAVQMGRKKVEDWTSSGQPGPSVPEAAGSAAGAAGRDGEEAHGTGPDATSGDGGMGESGTATSSDAPASSIGAPAYSNGASRHLAAQLAIPGYDALSASQVVQRLDGLSATELQDVRTHELGARRRRTILSRVDQLLAGASPDAR